jgi:hypothetical protein
VNANAAEEMNAVKPEHLVNALKKGKDHQHDETGIHPCCLWS